MDDRRPSTHSCPAAEAGITPASSVISTSNCSNCLRQLEGNIRVQRLDGETKVNVTFPIRDKMSAFDVEDAVCWNGTDTKSVELPSVQEHSEKLFARATK